MRYTNELLDDVRPVPGAPGYFATISGNVIGPKGVLTPQVNSSNGALYVNVVLGGKREHLKVARVVKLAWDGPMPSKAKVLRHWDDDPFNNNVDNLLWGTYSDNMIDKVRNGNHHEAKKTHCKRNHEFTSSNTYIYPDGRRRCKTCDRQSSWYSKGANPVKGTGNE